MTLNEKIICFDPNQKRGHYWYWYWLTYWSHVDKRHIKFMVSLPLNVAQGSHSAAPMGRGYGNIAQGSHAVASSSVGDRRTR